MSGILQHMPSPGATTAVVVGRAVPEVEPLIAAGESTLWIVDDEGWRMAPPALRESGAARLVVDRFDRSGFAEVIETFLMRDMLRLPEVVVTAAIPEALGERFAKVVDQLHAHYERNYRVRRTRQEEGARWQGQLLENVLDYMEWRLPRAWENALAGIPAFVCGAGPSLDVTAPLIARRRSSAVLFAADTALRTLARHGLQADFAVSVDAAKLPEKCLDDQTEPRCAVLASISPPAWKEYVAGRFCFLSGRLVTEDWLADHGIPKTPFVVTENCGITAIELARFLGCEPILLFGMDMAADDADPTRRHTGGADATIDRGSGYRVDGAMPRVPGNYRETVPTFMYAEWVALNDKLAGWPPDLVFNVNDRGARLDNTRLIDPAAFGAMPLHAARTDVSFEINAFDGTSPDVAQMAARMIGLEGMRGAYTCAALKDRLAGGELDAVVSGFRELFVGGDFARVMGSFGLKVMPHLGAEASLDAGLWRQLLDEADELCRKAAAVGIANNIDASRASA